MRLTLTLLGIELDLSIGPVSSEPDAGAALNGGLCATDRVLSATDTFMGFTNGREGPTYPEDRPGP